MDENAASTTGKRWHAAAAFAALFILALAAVWALPGGQPKAHRGDDPPTKRAESAEATKPDGMVLVPGGEFWMGSGDASYVDARPVHRVRVDPFWIDKTEVTNAQFAEFIAATGYRTVAEQAPDPAEFPDAPAEALVPGSIVFTPPDHQVPLDEYLAWWRYVPGADWRHPEGPDSHIDDRQDHPVVHVCWEDAAAYARWAGNRLPTEAEWEFAARGGLERQEYVWGDELTPAGQWRANIWQGQFPAENTVEDGFAGSSPVRSFPANGYGLFDMAGNVWEWCADWYRHDYYTKSPVKNPTGPVDPVDSFDPQEPGLPKRVQRGGSFLCSDVYCSRYKPGPRGKGEPRSAASHVGFRCARSSD